MMPRHQINYTAKSELMAPGRLTHGPFMKVLCQHGRLKIRMHFKVVRLVLDDELADPLHNGMPVCRYFHMQGGVFRMMGEMRAQHGAQLLIPLQGDSVMYNEQTSAPRYIRQQSGTLLRGYFLIGKFGISDNQLQSLEVVFVQETVIFRSLHLQIR